MDELHGDNIDIYEVTSEKLSVDGVSLKSVEVLIKYLEKKNVKGSIRLIYSDKKDYNFNYIEEQLEDWSVKNNVSLFVQFPTSKKRDSIIQKVKKLGTKQ